jgi:DNA polymerase-3 subunit beta
MKFTIDTKTLVDALASLIGGSKVIETNSRVPVFRQVHLKAGADGKVTLTGNDMDQSQTNCVAAEVEGAGETCVEAKTLQAFVKGLPKGSQVAVSLEDGKLILKSGSSRSAFEAYDAAKFPVLESKFNEAEAFDIDAAALSVALKQTAIAISTEETQYHLNGVYVTPVAEGADSLLRFVATDGHRLHKTAMAVPLHGREHTISSVIVPREAVAAVMKLLKKASHVRVHINPVRTEFHLSYKDANSVVYATKNIDGTFPNYERIIPGLRNLRATVDRAQLARIAAEMHKQSGGKALRMEFDENQLKISAMADGFERGETLGCVYQGRPFTVGFDGRYLSECLDALEGEHARDEVRFEWDSVKDAPIAPAVIVARDSGRTMTVLMPIRL